MKKKKMARTRRRVFDWRATRAWFRTGGYPGPKSDKPQKAICQNEKITSSRLARALINPRRIVSPAAIRQNRNGVNSISRFQTRSTYATPPPPSSPPPLRTKTRVYVCVCALMCWSARGRENFDSRRKLGTFTSSLFLRLSDDNRFFVAERVFRLKTFCSERIKNLQNIAGNFSILILIYFNLDFLF